MTFRFNLPKSFDLYAVMILLMAILAIFAPSSGRIDWVLQRLSPILLTTLFFLHGAKLSRESIIGGIKHWKLHLIILSGTFLFFPLIGLLLKPLALQFISPSLYTGFLFLCLLPSTVQSSIAFTSIAGGNVAAAVCSASISNVIGVILTPILVSLIIQAQHHSIFDIGLFMDSIRKTSLQILLPFIIGHLSRPWLIAWIQKHRGLTKLVDQSSILLIVYLAFSEAVLAGILAQMTWMEFLILIALSTILLIVIMLVMWKMASAAALSHEDRITALFCGSKKSLATGAPIARILFPGAESGPMILPLMIFHQIQLMVCSVLAQKWSRNREAKKRT